jgi:hypothetical protein
MSIKIGSNELTSAGSATYDGTDLYKIIYNGTTVWTKGGTFMPDNDIALYGLTYSGGNITFKVASRHDSDYIWITAHNPYAEVELQLELIWAGEIKSDTVGTNQHYESATQVFRWTLPSFTVPVAAMGVIQIPAITQTVAAPNLKAGTTYSQQILSDVMVIVHNLTTGEDMPAQIWDDGSYVNW